MDIRGAIIKELSCLITDLANRSYDKIIKTGRNGNMPMEIIQSTIAEFGELSLPTSESLLNTIIFEIEAGKSYSLDYPLWIKGERSDLTLQADIEISNSDQISIVIYDILVL